MAALVLAAATVTVTAAEVADRVAAFPEYTAVMLLLPMGKAAVLRLATPLTKLALPSRALPAKKLTVPTVVALPMFAISVTEAPTGWLAGVGA